LFERQINGHFAALDIDIIGPATAQIIKDCKHNMVDAKLDIRDFEYADSRVEMRELSQVARARLDDVRHDMLAASEHGIFSAIDVAHFSVQLDKIAELLE